MRRGKKRNGSDCSGSESPPAVECGFGALRPAGTPAATGRYRAIAYHANAESARRSRPIIASPFTAVTVDEGECRRTLDVQQAYQQYATSAAARWGSARI